MNGAEENNNPMPFFDPRESPIITDQSNSAVEERISTNHSIFCSKLEKTRLLPVTVANNSGLEAK